ncbi:MAG: DUF1475 family protein [Planctomycetota bacterium]|nr:DUF1475 family protein [Planctomycetota bacterium]
MRAAWALAIVGFVVMAAALSWVFAVGHFWEEGRVLVSLPWGVVSLFDVYTGLCLFSGWVAQRERHGWAAAIWIIGFMLLGNVLTAFYVLLALAQAKGSKEGFWFGTRPDAR